MPDFVTILTSRLPDRVGKSFFLVDSILKKRAVCSVTHAAAATIPVDAAADLVAVLQRVTESSNEVIVPGRWHGGDAPFEVLSEAKVAAMLGLKDEPVPGGVHTVSGRRVAARLRRGLEASSWLLLDADSPAGMPQDWRALSLSERLEKFDALLPGISACERVELRSSSARVSADGRFGGPSHAYIRLSDPLKIDALRAHVNIEMVRQDLAFASPRYSRQEPGKIIGHSQLTLFDTSVWVPGRLIFCARPDVTDAPGFAVADADIHIVNDGGGPLDITWLEPPSVDAMVDYRRKTGVRIRMPKGSSGVQIAEYGSLTEDTEITVKGVSRPLREWVGEMPPGTKLRCEAPFRASESEAGVIFVSTHGAASVHDVGIGTTYYLQKVPFIANEDELVEEAACLTADDTDAITEITLAAGKLQPIAQNRVLWALKNATGVSLGVLRDQISGTRKQEQRDGADQLALADLLLKQIGPANILCAGSDFWRWNAKRGVWELQPERAIKQEVQGVISAQGLEVDAKSVNGVTDVLANHIFQKDHSFNRGHPETVNCTNGELELVADEWVLGPHCREHYRTTQIPVAFDPAATAPLFEAFLEQVFRDDSDRDEKIRAVLELLGYSLMSHARHELFALLIGTGANGKSVLLAVVEALCGSENTAGVQPANFDRSFQRAHLHEKLANIVSEIKQGETLADAELKAIVSGELSTVEHKFKHPFTMRPYATCWFGTNHMPNTKDFSHGMFRRALILTFNRTFTKQEQDPKLKEKLISELPGILNICLAAYARATKEGFTRPISSEEAIAEWRLDTDPVAQFVAECCTVSPEGCVQASVLFAHYQSWADKNAIKKALSMKAFRDHLTRLGFSKKRLKEGNFVTGVEGVEGSTTWKNNR